MSEKLLTICKDFRKGILGRQSPKWMCFAVSAPLQAFLSVCGYETKLINGEVETKDHTIDHYWLELPDSQIIDATADQFNSFFKRKMPPVYIGAKPDWYLTE